MTYRDRPISCPRCFLTLVRRDERDHWRCGACRGSLVSLGELTSELLVIAPELMPEGGTSGVSTIARRTRDAPVPCGACGQPMDAVFLGGVAVDRCYSDEMFWFDATELERVLSSAAGQRDERSASWTKKLVRWLFE